MNRRELRLAGVALLLAVAVGYQYWQASQPVAKGGAPVASEAVRGPVAAELTRGTMPVLNPQAAHPATDFAPLFDHPLFDPTRNRRVEAVTEAAPQPSAEVAPAPAQPLGPAQPVLMGTVTSPWPGGAYLGDDQGGPVVFLRPGQAALGLHLETVTQDSATFMSEAGEVSLTLRKTDGAPQTTTAAPNEVVTVPAIVGATVDGGNPAPQMPAP